MKQQTRPATTARRCLGSGWMSSSYFEYRSLVVRRLGVTAEWRGLDWTDEAACTDHVGATPRLCARCPVTGRVPRCGRRPPTTSPSGAAASAESDREYLWAGMERTYRDVRDLELMRHRHQPTPPHAATSSGSRPTPRTGSGHDHRRPRRHRPVHRHHHGAHPRRTCNATPTAHRATSPTSSPTSSPRPPRTSADPTRLVAGRPGSWESSYVDGLVRGTMGDQPDDWTWFRTQPIVVRLNVAELIEDEHHHPGLMGLDEALENFDRRYESADTEHDVDAWDHDIDTITARYTTEYRLYAERFTARRTQPSPIRSPVCPPTCTSRPTPTRTATGGQSTATNNPVRSRQRSHSRSRSGTQRTTSRRCPTSTCGSDRKRGK